ncbi:flagellar protein FlaG [Lacimicrobium sp. SS2-24]|uniref:flagellar protein FlaG n=1 Tax=Lacimicrobium sp. SS2-24 TaxID=2005569 RepID=UPI001FEF6D4B|nr:flagellar protein FlaG [Lacimicrobium sp. SS2-24]
MSGGNAVAEKPVRESEQNGTTQDIKDRQQNADTKDTKREASDSGVAEAIEEIREFANLQSRQLDFSIDQDSQRRVIKVMDAETGDVIRQIPSEEVLQLAERIKELQTEVGAAVGVFFNKAV